MEKTKFWEEEPGQQSITRLMFGAMILIALFVVVYQVITTGTFEILQFSTIATIASGLKLIQKGQENKQESKQESKQDTKTDTTTNP